MKAQKLNAHGRYSIILALPKDLSLSDSSSARDFGTFMRILLYAQPDWWRRMYDLFAASHVEIAG